MAQACCPYCKGPVDGQGRSQIQGYLPECLRCGYGPWLPKGIVVQNGKAALKRPTFCPRCRSRIWDVSPEEKPLRSDAKVRAARQETRS